MPGSRFRTDIQGLRAVAILLVVGCHCAVPGFSGGFVGVDIFFVLSGYLITGLLVRELRECSTIDLGAFFARRARRLLPACAVVIGATLLAAAAIYPPSQMRVVAGSAGAAGLYVSNLYFDLGASNYFAPAAATDPLLHTWSLGVEEQFYLFWPLLILMTAGRRENRNLAPWTLISLAIVSLASCIALTHSHPAFAFYELPTRAWEFAAGGLVSLAPLRAPGAAPPLALLGGVAGFLTLAGCALSFSGGAGFPGWRATLPVLGTLAILHSGSLAPEKGIAAALRLAPMQAIGARSYSWYLWHWPILVFAKVVFPDLDLSGRLAAALVAFLLADATYRLIERPIRNSRLLQMRAAIPLGGALALTAAILSSSWALSAHARSEDRVDAVYRMISNASADLGDLPHTCWTEGNTYEAVSCEFGPADALHTVVLFGDSHAMQWFNAVHGAVEAEHWRLLTFVRPGCAARDLDPPDPSAGIEHCRQWRAQAIERMLAYHPSAIVLASFSAATVGGERIPSTEVGPATRRTLSRLTAAGIPIIILRDTPDPPADIPMCVNHYYPDVGRCDFDAATGLNSAEYEAERAAADGFPNVHFIDFTDILCSGSLCPAMLRGHIAYRDDSHLTGELARALIPEMRARLRSVLSFAQPEAQDDRAAATLAAQDVQAVSLAQ
jgi:peptidoglycan/LPS O-acetylase OafA/YrhL